jgi:hypothetical protein
VDLDGSPLGPVITSLPTPHVIVDSSPGKWHAYWLVTGVVLGDFTALQKDLAARFGGDPSVHDLPRVMRLPGFFHRKADPFMVRVAGVNDAEPLKASDFPKVEDSEAWKEEVIARDAGKATVDLDDDPSPWSALNSAALANLSAWVPSLFKGKAQFQPGTGAWRVSSKTLGRNLEEDLSLAPNGIKDWGVHDQGDEREGKRSPIDVVMEHGDKDFSAAVEWLREKLGNGAEASSGEASSEESASGGSAQAREQEARADERPSGLVIVRVSDVEAKRYNWLWKPRIARGKLTLLVGMPDVSKSTFALDLITRITHGSALPNDEGLAPLGSAIILSAEDAVADTIRPRLEVAGADLTRVHVITAVDTKQGGRRTFDLGQDIRRLEREVLRIGDVKLIVVDPFSAYMGKPGKLDTFRSTDVRATLAPLQDMAERLEVAVIGIGHLNKSGSMSALLRVLDSVAFVAAARGVYLIVRDPEDDERRLLLPAKNNIGKIRTGLSFRIVEKLAPPPVFDSYPALKWEDGAVDMTADEALAWKADGRRSEAAEKAKRLILEMLANGAVRQRDVQAKAAEQQIGAKSLRTAKDALGIVSTRAEGAWWWSLPTQSRPM